MKTFLSTLILVLTIAHAQAQWVSQTSPNLPNSMIYEVETIDANIVWAASPFMDVIKTIDGGATWNTFPINDPFFTNAGITSISALDANNAWVIATEMGPTGVSRVYRTINGGITWFHQTTSFPIPGSFGLYIHFFDLNNGVTLGEAPTPGGLLRNEFLTTSDGGLTWNSVPPTYMPAVPFDHLLYNTLTTVGNTIWVMDLNFNILKSIDKGVTWTAMNSGLTHAGGSYKSVLAFTDANNGLAGINGQLKRTTDGGATWTTVNSTGTWFPFRIIPIPGTSSYVSSSLERNNPGSAISHDHGNTWTLIENTHRHFDMEFADATTGFSSAFNSMNKFSGSVLGINKNIQALNNKIFIGPNPSTGIFKLYNLPNQPFTMEVFDLTGTKVLHQNQALFGSNRIDLSSQPRGVYILRLFSGGQVKSFKLVLN